MTTPDNAPSTEQPKQPDNKELNFRNLEARYQRQLDEEKRRNQELEKKIAESQRSSKNDDDDDDDEPYVDKKKLARQFSNFEKSMEEKIEKQAEAKARNLIYQDRQQTWVKQNNDFFDVMKHADKLADLDPDLAESILEMPEGFERQKLVYRSLKRLGLHQEKPKEPSIQDKIDANRKGAFYQPSNVGTAPYATQGDYSPQGKKSAYEHMQSLKNRLRLG